MKDVLFKLRILYIDLYGAYEQWHIRIWTKDLDEQTCCDGRECGCMGSTIREEESFFLNKNLKP